MAEEIIDNEEQNINKTEERITKLSSKVKLTAEERDAEKNRADTAEKERDFFKGFTNVTTKYTNAHEYQDKIWEKVQVGYTVEDATVSVLNAEGKLVPTPVAPPPPPPPAAGGSASVTLPDGGAKSPGQMTQAERRSALIDAEKRGELSG